MAARIESSPRWILIFALLCLNFLSLTPNSNEEVYFLHAKLFSDPSWFNDPLHLESIGGHIILFAGLSGTLLKFFSFETTIFLSQIFNFLLLSLGVSAFTRVFTIKNNELLILLQLLFFPMQTFFAGEWIFRGVEPKTYAYVFIFFALASYARGQMLKSVLWIALASYFHCLLGGWIAFYLLLAHFFSNAKQSIKAFLVYSGLMLPFAVYLWKLGLIGGNAVVEGLNSDWIVVYFRNPHHLAPFKSVDYFFKNFFSGTVLACAALVFTFWYKPKTDQLETIKRLLQFMLIGLTTCLVISYFDSTGTFLKLYPFRIASLALFLFLMILLIAVQAKFRIPKELLFALFLPFFLSESVLNLRSLTYPKSTEHFDELVEFVKGNSDSSDIFLFSGFRYETAQLPFTRKAKRQRFAIMKFGATKPEKIVERYKRLKLKQKLAKDSSVLSTITKKYKVDYLITPGEFHSSLVSEVFRNRRYRMYKISG